MRKSRRPALLLAAALCARAGLTLAASPCDAFAWDVGHERALFASQARDQRAGDTVAAAPTIVLDNLYRLSLSPQARVAFAVPPGKKAHGEPGYAGLARLHVAADGLYRIALGGRLWIDVVQDGRLVKSAAFTGAHGCSAPRKIVLFRLVAGDALLQVSGGPGPQTELTVTRAPEPAAQSRP